MSGELKSARDSMKTEKRFPSSPPFLRVEAGRYSLWGKNRVDIEAIQVDPNLEHAYVHYMDNKLEHWNLK